jgi:hypothetical protein
MGQVYSEQLSKPGAYLLSLLAAEGSVRFSRFYNDDTDYAALAAAAGVNESDADHAHVLIEFAAGQFETAGLVLFTPLGEKLIDGERDYLISLTDSGRALVAGGGRFRYRDMDL